MKTADRFWKKVNKTESCWNWTAYTFKGYGIFGKDGTNVRAHRFAYELLVGPIPDGLTLDHICRNRACVNPLHLEPVSNRVNILRGSGVTAVNSRKTHCIHGHRFDTENTRPTKRGRECRACCRRRWHERQARRKAVA